MLSESRVRENLTHGLTVETFDTSCQGRHYSTLQFCSFFLKRSDLMLYSVAAISLFFESRKAESRMIREAIACLHSPIV